VGKELSGELEQTMRVSPRFEAEGIPQTMVRRGVRQLGGGLQQEASSAFAMGRSSR